MGTTCVALLLCHGEARVGWIGDSRAYVWRDGELRQLTHDHSLVEDWVRMGRLSAEEAAQHPRRAELTRAVGISDEIEPEFHRLEARPGDRFMLCSDGLCGVVEAEQLGLVIGSQPPESAIRTLLELAVQNGTRDNITVQIAECRAPERSRAHRAGAGAGAGSRAGLLRWILGAAIAAAFGLGTAFGLAIAADGGAQLPASSDASNQTRGSP